MNNIDDFEDVVPERVTKLKTSSEVARERALAKAGLDANWYHQHVDASRNSNGEPTCESCGQVETKKLPNGKIKELVVDTTNKKLVCQRCADRNYRQSQRDKVMKRDDREGAESMPTFWKRNRNALEEIKKAQLEDKDGDAILLWNEVKAVLREAEAGEEFDEDNLRDLIREVCRSIVENGTTFTDLIHVDFYRPQFQHIYEQYMQQGGATALFVQLGYIVGIPQSDAYRFMEFTERRLGLPVAQFETFPTRIERIYNALDHGKVWKQPDQVIKCATPGCGETTTIPPQVTKFVPRDDEGNFSLVTENIAPSQWWCEEHEKARQAAGRAYLAQFRSDNVEKMLNAEKPPQRWARSFDTKAEREAKERDIPFGEEGPYL